MFFCFFEKRQLNRRLVICLMDYSTLALRFVRLHKQGLEGVPRHVQLFCNAVVIMILIRHKLGNTVS